MAAPEGYKALGKIGISYKGEYASNTAYERLDAVYHNGSTYLAIKDAPDGAPRDDKINWIYLAKGFNSDIGDSEITFTQASIRENIDTGESVRTVFGKIKKFFADLTAPAFAQMITTKDDLLATKATGYVPDAKAVADAVTDVNSNLTLGGWLPFCINKNIVFSEGTAYVAIDDNVQAKRVVANATVVWNTFNGNAYVEQTTTTDGKLIIRCYDGASGHEGVAWLAISGIYTTD